MPMQTGRRTVSILLVALFGAGPASAESDLPATVDVRSAQLLPQRGEPIHVTGGCWLRTDTCLDSARRQVELQSRVDALEEALVRPQTPTAAVIAVATGVALAAFGAGYLVARIGASPR